MRQVVVIAGPICAGKTTLAHKLADENGGRVLDRDEIARAMGSPRKWLHSKTYSRQAEHVMRLELDQIAKAREGIVYVVRSLPVAAQRAALVDRLRAELILLDPGRDECIRRARVDRRPPGSVPAIHRWYARYLPGTEEQEPEEHFATSRDW
ncbi:AAA family ATPase [Amycolatopsis sp. NPDC102389]|uniref:AAA family ATPase n=1 Tax=Amycolatopsis sp. NPDC102389 TaxID=3363941 RepID=UPI00382C0FC8